ncbi:MAG: glycosyltransferase family 2 protein [Sphingobacteriales bacterium]|nr:glycosyltransferase family 2 protein [Sphingobacteriales bacterium]MBI3720118.1 glycosyltransferase family 2 protein [Sphingobacteriales bacterium]
MTNHPSVAVVILNWNGKNYLQQFLPSVMQSAYPNLQVIVADNASTDDSVTFLQTNYPQIEIIINAANEGFAKGYNMALKQVQADYFILLNSDIEVTPGWIEPVISLMESDKAIAACQPKLLAFNNKKQFEYAGAAGGWIDDYGYPFSRGRVFDVCEEDNGQYDEVQQIFWASGAAFFVRSSVFNEMKGFDEFFFAHQEEIDLCWRMQLSGYKIYACPQSVVYHVGGGTLPKGNSKKTWLNYRNNLIMLYKNLPVGEKLWKIPFRIALDAISAWKALLTGDAGYWMAVLKAHIDFLKWIISQQSQSNFSPVRKAKPSGVYHGNIVWQYFINKKHSFKEIMGR